MKRLTHAWKFLTDNLSNFLFVLKTKNGFRRQNSLIGEDSELVHRRIWSKVCRAPPRYLLLITKNNSIIRRTSMTQRLVENTLHTLAHFRLYRLSSRICIFQRNIVKFLILKNHFEVRGYHKGASWKPKKGYLKINARLIYEYWILEWVPPKKSIGKSSSVISELTAMKLGKGLQSFAVFKFENINW